MDIYLITPHSFLWGVVSFNALASTAFLLLKVKVNIIVCVDVIIHLYPEPNAGLADLCP